MQTLDVAQMYSYDGIPGDHFHNVGDAISRTKNTGQRLRPSFREIDFRQEY
jgi:hypothetical protein